MPKKIANATKKCEDKNVLILNSVTHRDNLHVIEPSNLFESLISPLSREQFMKTFYNKKALVVRGDPTRLPEVNKAVFNLDPYKMMRNSASDEIHIWQPSKSGIHSYSTDSVKEAARAYNSEQASLYFSSSLEMRVQWCKRLLH